MQAIVLGFTLLAPAIVAIIPLFAAMVVSIKAIAAVKFGALLAGIIPAVTALAAPFAPFLVGGAIVVGIIALGKLIGTLAGHVFASRDKIGEGINAIKDFFIAFKEGVVIMFTAIGDAIKKPFVVYADFVKGVFTNVVSAIQNAFNALPNFVKTAINAATAPVRNFINLIKRALQALRNLMKKKGSSNTGSGSGSGTAMALGGVVTSPTLGYLGEAGSEYVIPARKAAQFSKNYLAGYRGSAAVPRFAEGGYVAPNVNITTGAVTQMDGTNFITTNDLASAVQSGIDQTLIMLQSDLRTRRSLGLS